MKEKIEIEKIEIEKIDTLEAQKKFSELLEEKKTFFLNGAWAVVRLNF